MRFIFTPWRNFIAYRDRRVTTAFLRFAAKDMEKEYKKRILSPPKTGRIYHRKHGRHQASRAGEFPANETGALARSVRSNSNATEASVGTNMFYSKFLREGTRKMARRRMADDILKLVAPRTLARLKGWVCWKYV